MSIRYVSTIVRKILRMMAKRRSSVIMYVRASLRILLGSCILIFTRLMLAKSQNTKMLKKVEVNNDIYICIFVINVRHLGLYLSTILMVSVHKIPTIKKISIIFYGDLEKVLVLVYRKCLRQIVKNYVI